MYINDEVRINAVLKTAIGIYLDYYYPNISNKTLLAGYYETIRDYIDQKCFELSLAEAVHKSKLEKREELEREKEELKEKIENINAKLKVIEGE